MWTYDPALISSGPVPPPYTIKTNDTGNKREEEKLSSQDQIDKEVREALENPRREAEVKRRVELAEKIGKDTYEVGTVLKWTRKYRRSKGGYNEYLYVAIKTGEDIWFVTGELLYSTSGYKWDHLVQWMVTGEGIVENLEVANLWLSVTD